jgi:hypothetical protein
MRAYIRCTMTAIVMMVALLHAQGLRCAVRASTLTEDAYSMKIVGVVPTIIHIGRHPAMTEADLGAAYGLDSKLPDRYQVVPLAPEPLKALIDRSRQIRSIQDLNQLVLTVLVPSFSSWVDARISQLAEQYLEEKDRVRFSATEGGETGVDARLMEMVQDNTFLGVPYVEWLGTTGEGTQIGYRAGVAWFVPVRAQGKTSWQPRQATQLLSYTHEVSPKRGGYESVVYGFQENLDLSMRLEEKFAFRSQVLDVQGGKLLLGAGRHEGVRVDDRYYIYEYVQDSTYQDPTRRQVGWATITKLRPPAEGGPYRSEATLRRGADPKPGMLLEEIPRSALEVTWCLEQIPIRVGPAAVKYQDAAMWTSSLASTRSAFAINFGGSYDIGREINHPQFYAGSRLKLGGFALRASLGREAPKERLMSLIGIDVGVGRRMYWRTLGVEVGARYGVLGIANVIKQADDEAGEKRKIDVWARGWGPSVEVGLTLMTTPLTTIQLLGERRWYRDSWRTTVDGKSTEAAGQPDLGLDRWGIKLVASGSVRNY